MSTSKPMASTTSLLAESPQKSILEDGVFYAEDPVIGKRVDDFAQNGFPFRTEEGLDFCKVNALDDKRIRNVIESYFNEWSCLGLFKVFGPYPSRAYSFINRMEEETKAQALIVQLWSRGSRMVYYSGSHLQSLNAKPADVGLLEIPLDRLKRTEEQPSIKHIEVDMKDGGLAILDGRLGFTIVQGKAITIGFAVREELEHWGKMRLPNVENLKRKVADMKSTTIGVNFYFPE
ncbi:hypothetical protein BKA61DRAFT_80452 [Leptodontidium sp. MPI-SDFR-AT-0119]|nr:hypothetical protein BKA61DRAFT_80452 [Leptodontidium sp. MPI-SDFR-AT-0119]